MPARAAVSQDLNTRNRMANDYMRCDSNGFVTDMKVIQIGEVICVYKIMPESPETFEKVKKALEAMEPNRLEEEPVAFGLKAVIFTKIIPDGDGVLEELENKLNGIDGVGSVENIRTSRAM